MSEHKHEWMVYIDASETEITGACCVVCGEERSREWVFSALSDVENLRKLLVDHQDELLADDGLIVDMQHLVNEAEAKAARYRRALELWEGAYASPVPGHPSIADARAAGRAVLSEPEGQWLQLAKDMARYLDAICDPNNCECCDGRPDCELRQLRKRAWDAGLIRHEVNHAE